MLDVLPVTVVIPTRNEETSLPSCLAGVIGFRHVIVVDSSSTDRTPEIAAEARTEVIEFRWQGGFPKKRNWVLLNHRFETPWVLFLDADERLTQDFRRELAGKLEDSDCAGYWLTYNIHFQGKILRHGIAQRKLALFRIGAGLYEQIDDPGWSSLDMEVHEHPVLNGKIGNIAAPIDHLDFKGMYQFIQRHNEYSSWEARRYLALDGHNASHLSARQAAKYRLLERWWYPFGYFLLAYVLKRGFLDGRAGFVYAAMKSVYFLQVQEKIAEARKAA